MREIKFRSWNANEKRMVTPALWINECNLPSSQMCSAPTHPLMQFTGLKDCHGADIYEGDILKIKFYDDFSNDCVDVEMSEDGRCEFFTKVHWCANGYWLFSEIDSCWYFPQSLYDCATIEVIGNIHENPELLENLK